ncbi:MAG: S-formylglutathione hydrolase [Bradymonadia bacterium]
MKRLSSTASFGGRQEVWQHDSETLGVPMKFGIYLPQQVAKGPRPMLTYLSGLTCTEQNVITKGGFQQECSTYGVVMLTPDTSPRGEQVPDDEAWDLGQGAGFYLNATQAPWSTHYKMYDYVLEELPALVRAHFPVSDREGITGHSMGGHGALVLALRNPGRYTSVSAFAPIVAPSQVHWGRKAFTQYLGDDRERWKAYDATDLVAHAEERLPILIDQGLADGFLDEQLQPQRFAEACQAAGHPLNLRLHEGYDHSYYFIATFAGEHVIHHAQALLER